MRDLDPYAVLGIPRTADADAVRAAFRRAVRREHPDTSPTTQDGAGVGPVLDAYRLLIDPDTRARYDAATEHGSQGSSSVRVPVRVGPPADPEERPPPSRCRDCRGSGVVTTRTVCPRCLGAAVATEIDVRRARIVRCGGCRGSGAVTVREACGACGGSGWHRLQNEDR